MKNVMNDNALKDYAASNGDEIPDPQFFHNNLHHREVIATLRYGIEARKGLILFSGDAGTGKTTLIHRLKRELDPSVTCILEPNSGANFTDLLRLILRHLHAGDGISDPPSSVESCKALLRAQHELGHIVCLIIDNAQHLDELTLEYLMETFFPAQAEERDNHLLQVVLAGRPPLREKLLHPWLRPLNPHLGLVCHVEPLREEDVASYADNQLRAARFPADLMDRQAVAPLISYTGGNPRLISELCARAIELASASPARRITAETISTAARDLGLGETWRSRLKDKPIMDFSSEKNDKPHLEFSSERKDKPDLNFPIERNNRPEPDFSRERNDKSGSNFSSERSERNEEFSFESSEAETTDMLIQTFLQDTPARGRRWFTVGRRGTTLGLGLPLLLIGVFAIWTNRDVIGQRLADSSEQLKVISGWSEFSAALKAPAEPPAQPRDSMEPPPVPPMADIPPVRDIAPATDAPARQTQDTAKSFSAPRQGKIPNERSTAAGENFAQDRARSGAKTPPSPADNGQQRSRSETAEIRRRQIEAQVQKAIENRAIEGVEVSVIDGTAYLKGRVASERQKRAAERAAGSVGGVERVRNRIEVG